MIPSRQIFDEYASNYDRWFDEHPDIYRVQLGMLRDAVPHNGRGLEIGAGSGRFSDPLGIAYGIDPSCGLLKDGKEPGYRGRAWRG